MNFLKDLFKSFIKRIDDSSEGGSLNKTDLVKVLRTTILVSIASGLTYFAGNVDPEHLGVYGVLVVPVVTAVLEMVNKYIKANK